MENQLAKKENGSDLLPASTKNKLQELSFDHYDQIGLRSVRDLVKNASKLIKIQHILDYHHDTGKVIGETFIKSLDRVGRFTGVKTWIDGEGVRFFMNYVIREYPLLTLADIHIFCNKIIEGAYGHAFENISVQKLIMWFNEYVKEREWKIHDVKKEMEQDKEKDDLSNIDKKGLKRMADKFGEIHRVHLKKESMKEPAYLSISEFIERNELDPEEFRGELKERFEDELKAVLDKHENFTMENLPKHYRESMFRNYKNNFLKDENKKLNK